MAFGLRLLGIIESEDLGLMGANGCGESGLRGGTRVLVGGVGSGGDPESDGIEQKTARCGAGKGCPGKRDELKPVSKTPGGLVGSAKGGW